VQKISYHNSRSLLQAQRYLEFVLGVSIQLEPLPEEQQASLPIFLKKLYAFYQAELFDRQIIFLIKLSSGDFTVKQLAHQAELLAEALKRPVVFVLPALEAYQRQRLIKQRVSFLVPGKQLFLSPLLVDLREYRPAKIRRGGGLLPAAQCLLLYHLLKENLEAFELKTIAAKLDYTPMTISRAARSLAAAGLAVVKGTKKKRIVFHNDRTALWRQALPRLYSPVAKVYSLVEAPPSDLACHSSYTALAHYTNIAEDEVRYYAVSRHTYKALTRERRIRVIESNEAEIRLEVWLYDPRLLADNQVVDPLSLYLSLKNERDERVRQALEELLEGVW